MDETTSTEVTTEAGQPQSQLTSYGDSPLENEETSVAPRYPRRVHKSPARYRQPPALLRGEEICGVMP